MVTHWRPFLILTFNSRPKSRDNTRHETPFLLLFLGQDLDVKFWVLVRLTGCRVFSSSASIIDPKLDFVSIVENSPFADVPLEE